MTLTPTLHAGGVLVSGVLLYLVRTCKRERFAQME